MEFDAITFDTQVVVTNGFDFDGALLAQLKQFKNGPTKVVVAGIVVQEVGKHLRNALLSSKDKLEAAHKKAVYFGLKDKDSKAFDGPIDIRQHTRDQLKTFLEGIGAELISTDDVPVKDILYRYTRALPPFEKSGDKKSEFPDAIALLALEKWAQTNDKKILAVSGDGGWKEFQSERLTVVGTLTDALAVLNAGADKAQALAEQFMQLMCDDQSALHEQFGKELADAVTNMPCHGDGSSSYRLESEGVALTLTDFQLPSDHDDFVLVQAGRHKITVQITVTITVDAHGDFTVFLWDGIDREEISMGSTSAGAVDEQLDVEALVTFEGDFDKGDVAVTTVEILDEDASIDFGEVQIDFGPPEDEVEYPGAF